jgi:hypothetical protein
MAAITARMGSMGKTTIVSTQTDTMGGFVATDVAPGDYYVFASVGGYVQPLAMVQAALDSGADRKKPLPGIPVVHVVADHAAVADVTIDRGAAVSGTVLWDDGTPVNGSHVRVVPAKGEADDVPPQLGMLAMSGSLISLLSLTDDLGNYRIAGLAPGEYLVKVTLPQATALNMTGGAMNLGKMMNDKPLDVWATASFHKSSAKSVVLHRAEDLRDVQVTVNLGGMHSVSGRVGSAEDHHGLNSALVSLKDTQDKDFVRTASVDAAGNFTVTFVPPGTYDLVVADGADTEPEKKKDKEKPGLLNFTKEHTLRSYDDLKQSLIVADTDVAGLNLELKQAKTVKKDMDFGSLLTE